MMDIPKEGRRVLLILQGGQPVVAMRVKDMICSYTFKDNDFIETFHVDMTHLRVDRWAYISDIESTSHLWHI